MGVSDLDEMLIWSEKDIRVHLIFKDECNFASKGDNRGGIIAGRFMRFENSFCANQLQTYCFNVRLLP